MPLTSSLDDYMTCTVNSRNHNCRVSVTRPMRSRFHNLNSSSEEQKLRRGCWFNCCVNGPYYSSYHPSICQPLILLLVHFSGNISSTVMKKLEMHLILLQIYSDVWLFQLLISLTGAWVGGLGGGFCAPWVHFWFVIIYQWFLNSSFECQMCSTHQSVQSEIKTTASDIRFNLCDFESDTYK